MKNSPMKIFLSVAVIFVMMSASVAIDAAPVNYKQVVQVVNAKPGKAGTGNFSQLRLARKNFALTLNDGDGDDKKDGDEKKKESAAPTQDDRVITITTEEIAENEECDCVEAIEIAKTGIPKWPFFGLGAIPFIFIPPPKTDSPTPTPPTTQTPTPMTPTPTPPPVPEPMTLLLFGTGLAGIGLAARKKFGKKDETES